MNNNFDVFFYLKYMKMHQNKKFALNTKLSNDHIYYNINVAGKGYYTNPIFYEENRVQPLLDNPSDFHLTIDKFFLPLNSIPVTVMRPPDGASFVVGPPSGYETEYTVTLDHNGDIQQATVLYNSLNGPSIPAPQQLPSGVWPDTPYWYVQSYEHIIRMFNDALSYAHSQLAAPPSASPPYFQYNEDTKLVDLVTTVAGYLSTEPDATRIDIYLNINSSIKFFRGFDVEVTELSQGRDILYPIYPWVKNYFTPQTIYPPTPPASPVPLWIKKIQDFSAVSYCFDLKDIVFISNTIPASKEFTSQFNESGNVVQIGIIKDFTPNLSDLQSQKDIALFVSEQDINFTLIDLLSTIPLYKIDLSVYWRDRNNFLRPLYLNHTHTFSCKLLFIKKTDITHELKKGNY